MSLMVLSMFQVVLVIILVILVLLQPPASSSLSGFSNPQQGFNSIVPIKSSVSPLSKVTGVIVGLFIINTILLSGLYSKDIHKKSIAEKIEVEKKQEDSVPFEN
ncbi:MAG: preprotein translocase subunit SecG [Wolbachia endosymbiont of Tyrophagus putrescentiae]|nr:preprotein translocase subunit SecG [Wolbachia endosymbiont of Tyrophagus putrescentiae]